jgi:hypothetical protein
MNTLFPVYTWLALGLLLLQTYLIIFIGLLLLKKIKLLKQPYSGMEFSEVLPAGMVLLCVLFISSADVPGLFQSTRVYMDSKDSPSHASFIQFTRFFLVVLFFGILYIIIRYFFRANEKEVSLPVSILHCAIIIGFAIICWIVCKELVDRMTPQFINFR